MARSRHRRNQQAFGASGAGPLRAHQQEAPDRDLPLDLSRCICISVFQNSAIDLSSAALDLSISPLDLSANPLDLSVSGVIDLSIEKEEILSALDQTLPEQMTAITEEDIYNVSRK